MDEESPQKTAARKEAAPAPAAPVADQDLSKEIERAMEREPRDQVRCVRVFGNYYRCNWWCPVAGPATRMDYNWGGILMDFIRKSRFLTASMQGGNLVVKEVNSAAEPVGRLK